MIPNDTLQPQLISLYINDTNSLRNERRLLMHGGTMFSHCWIKPTEITW